MNWSDVTGTVADWVMASAAVYAALNAKQWFSQRSHTKGFDKAEEILSNIDSVYYSTYKSVHDLHQTLGYTNLINKHLSNATILDDLNLENLKSSHLRTLEKIESINEDIELIDRWSIKVQNKDFIKSTTKAIREVNICALNAYRTVQSIALAADNKSIGLAIKNFKQHYAEYLKDYSEMEKIYNDFRGHKFVSFFKVK